MNKKERVISEFEMGLKKSFCWRSKLSNREIKIHVYARRQTWICTTWPSFPLNVRVLFIASTEK